MNASSHFHGNAAPESRLGSSTPGLRSYLVPPFNRLCSGWTEDLYISNQHATIPESGAQGLRERVGHLKPPGGPDMARDRLTGTAACGPPGLRNLNWHSQNPRGLACPSVCKAPSWTTVKLLKPGAQ